MNYFESLDLTTQRSLRAVLLCVLGTALGLVIMNLISWISFFTLLSGPLYLSIFGLLVIDWTLRDDKPIYDPSTTFLTFAISMIASKSFISHFFITPEIGPFAPDSWTIPAILGHVAFGFTLPVLIAATLGLTYFTAHTTTKRSSWSNALLYLTVIVAPLIFLFTINSMSAGILR